MLLFTLGGRPRGVFLGASPSSSSSPSSLLSLLLWCFLLPGMDVSLSLRDVLGAEADVAVLPIP